MQADTFITSQISTITEGDFDIDSLSQVIEKIPIDNVDPKTLLKQIMNVLIEKNVNNQTYIKDKLFRDLKLIFEWIYDHYCQKKQSIMEILFFPNIESEHRIISYVKQAKKTIDLAIFTLSNDNLANALRESHERGIKIRIITDDDFVDKIGSDILDLSKEGINIRTDESKKALMHNKFAILDEKLILTGSYNWTAQATNHNQENLIVLENEYAVGKYKNRFDELWSKFESYNFDKTMNTGIHKTKLYENYLKSEEKKQKQEEKEKKREEKEREKEEKARKKLEKEREKLEKEKEKLEKEKEKLEKDKEKLEKEKKKLEKENKPSKKAKKSRKNEDSFIIQDNCQELSANTTDVSEHGMTPMKESDIQMIPGISKRSKRIKKLSEIDVDISVVIPVLQEEKSPLLPLE